MKGLRLKGKLAVSAEDRARVHRRFADRAAFLARWLTRIVLPRYWKPILAAMALRTGGALTEAASFLVAAQLFINWAQIEPSLPGAFDNPYLVGGATLFTLIAAGAMCSYVGDRIAVRLSLDFETASFARAVVFVQSFRQRGGELDRSEEKDIFFAAPRFMARTVALGIGVGTSLVMIFVGTVGCVYVFPSLSAIIGLMFVVTSPAYVYHALHSTRVGHWYRASAKDYSAAKKALSRRWLKSDQPNPDVFEADAAADPDYMSFLNAYGQRLIISPVNQLIVNSMLAACVLAALVWMSFYTEASETSISHIVSFLVFMKVFFSGVKAIVGSLQIIASFVPSFLLFLEIDPEMKQPSARA